MMLHHRIISQADTRGDAPALVSDTGTLTYRELVARATAVAGSLHARGIGPGDLVAVLGSRDHGLIVGMLGACMAGAAYLPLDAGYPAAQLEFMAKEAGAAAVIADAAIAQMPLWQGLAVIVIGADGQLSETSEASPSLPAVAASVDPDRPLYVIFTSGSTGTPKGVVISHANLVRLFDVTASLFAFGPQDIWTFFHSFAFDFSVWEIWGALTSGGRLVLVDYRTSRDPFAFYDLVARHRVTILNQTPSAFTNFELVDALRQSQLCLRLVVFGGERLGPGMLRSWWKRHPGGQPRLVNMYGITETTVHVTYRELDERDGEGDVSPIGVPLPDLQVTLRDAEGGLVPQGEVGEIYVSGPGVASGYLNQPALTAERFVQIEGRRWYRSGDLARWSGAEFEYHGRIDKQVKVRGHRIELGEVEMQLAAAPAVRAATVTVQSGRLVAYVVVDADYSDSALRDHLSRKLPPHMVPARLVACDTLPLTVNGKLDPSSVETLKQPGTVSQAASLKPGAEQIIADIWAEILELEEIGPSDNFFNLGGDSLLAVDIVTAAARQGLTIPVTAVFQAQTLAQLAALAQPQQGAQGAGNGSEAAAGSLTRLGGDATPAVVSVEFLGDSQSPGPARLLTEVEPERRVYKIDPVLGVSLLADPNSLGQLIDAYSALIADREVIVVGYCGGSAFAEQLAAALAAQQKTLVGAVMISPFTPTEDDLVTEFGLLYDRLGGGTQQQPVFSTSRPTVAELLTALAAQVHHYVATQGIHGAEAKAVEDDIMRRYEGWLWYLHGLIQLPAVKLDTPTRVLAADDGGAAEDGPHVSVIPGARDAAAVIAGERVRRLILDLQAD